MKAAKAIVKEIEDKLNGIIKTPVSVVVHTMTKESISVLEWCQSPKAFVAADGMHSPKSDFMKLIDSGAKVIIPARNQLQDKSQTLSTALGKLNELENEFESKLQANPKLLQRGKSAEVIGAFRRTLENTAVTWNNIRRKIRRVYYAINALKVDLDEVDKSAALKSHGTRAMFIELAQIFGVNCNKLQASAA